MKRVRKKPVASINVVPYIDVMLVLLVIFMITAPMLTQGVKVDLPIAQTSSIDSEEALPLIITIDKEGHYFLNDENQQSQVLNLNNILVRVIAETKLAKLEHKEKNILVRGDKNVAYGQVIELMATLKNAGIPHVGLMTEPLGSEAQA